MTVTDYDPPIPVIKYVFPGSELLEIRNVVRIEKYHDGEIVKTKQGSTVHVAGEWYYKAIEKQQ